MTPSRVPSNMKWSYNTPASHDRCLQEHSVRTEGRSVLKSYMARCTRRLSCCASSYHIKASSQRDKATGRISVRKAYPEALHVEIKAERFNNHGGSFSKSLSTTRAKLLATDRPKITKIKK